MWVSDGPSFAMLYVCLTMPRHGTVHEHLISTSRSPFLSSSETSKLFIGMVTASKMTLLMSSAPSIGSGTAALTSVPWWLLKVPSAKSETVLTLRRKSIVQIAQNSSFGSISVALGIVKTSSTISLQ